MTNNINVAETRDSFLARRLATLWADPSTSEDTLFRVAYEIFDDTSVDVYSKKRGLSTDEVEDCMGEAISALLEVSRTQRRGTIKSPYGWLKRTVDYKVNKYIKLLMADRHMIGELFPYQFQKPIVQVCSPDGSEEGNDNQILNSSGSDGDCLAVANDGACRGNLNFADDVHILNVEKNIITWIEEVLSTEETDEDRSMYIKKMLEIIDELPPMLKQAAQFIIHPDYCDLRNQGPVASKVLGITSEAFRTNKLRAMNVIRQCMCDFRKSRKEFIDDLDD